MLSFYVIDSNSHACYNIGKLRLFYGHTSKRGCYIINIIYAFSQEEIKMRIDLADEPDKTLLSWRYIKKPLPKSCSIAVPHGLEAVVAINGEIFETLYEGSEKSYKGLSDLYVVRKSAVHTRQWGVGNIDYIDNETGKNKRIGANGPFSVGVDNSFNFVQAVALNNDTLCINDIKGLITPKLTAVAKSVFSKAVNRWDLNMAARQMKNELTELLYIQYGLFLEDISVDSIIEG
jgi:hypothetical protein